MDYYSNPYGLCMRMQSDARVHTMCSVQDRAIDGEVTLETHVQHGTMAVYRCRKSNNFLINLSTLTDLHAACSWLQPQLHDDCARQIGLFELQVHEAIPISV